MVNFGAIGKTVGEGLGNISDYVGNKKQMESQQAALAENQDYFTNAMGDMSTDYNTAMSPYIDSGQTALSNYEGVDSTVSNYGNDGSGFEMTNFETSPSYDWRMSQGTEALDQGAASGGSLYSGGQDKALLEYGQNLASEEYDNEYDRQMAEYQDTRDYNTALDSSNIASNLNQYNTLMNQGYDATTNNANTQLGLDEALTQGTMDMTSQAGDLSGAQQSNFWGTIGDQNRIAGQGMEDYFSMGAGSGGGFGG